MLKINGFLASSLALSLGFSSYLCAQENSLTYTYAELGYQTGELIEEDYDGVLFGGSIALNETAYILGKFLSAESEDEYDSSFGTDKVEFTQFNIGLGIHVPVYTQTDFITAISYVENKLEFVDVEAEGTGFLLNVGFRGKPSETMELAALFDYADIEDETETGYTFSARIYPNEKFSLGLTYATSDELDSLSISLRVDI